MGRTACTEPQYLYKGALYFYFTDADKIGQLDSKASTRF